VLIGIANGEGKDQEIVAQLICNRRWESEQGGWETSQVFFRVLLMRTSSAPAPKCRASASVKPVVQPRRGTHQHRAPRIPPHLHRAVGSQQHRQRGVEDERHEGDCDTDPRVMRSAIHRSGGRPGRATLGGVGFLEFGDGRVEVESADVPADDPVDEASRLVEVGGGGHQVGVRPHRVAGVQEQVTLRERPAL
jgi:hypothetical protein